MVSWDEKGIIEKNSNSRFFQNDFKWLNRIEWFENNFFETILKWFREIEWFWVNFKWFLDQKWNNYCIIRSKKNFFRSITENLNIVVSCWTKHVIPPRRLTGHKLHCTLWTIYFGIPLWSTLEYVLLKIPRSSKIVSKNF